MKTKYVTLRHSPEEARRIKKAKRRAKVVVKLSKMLAPTAIKY